MIHHSITYTIYSAEAREHYENNATLYRSRPLTHEGAQRILRRELKKPTLNVVRVEKSHWSQ